MLRNIPNRVDFEDMKQFLDETQESHYDCSYLGMFLACSSRLLIRSNGYEPDNVHALESHLIEPRWVIYCETQSTNVFAAKKGSSGDMIIPDDQIYTKTQVKAVHKSGNANYTKTQANEAYEFEKELYTIVLLYCEIPTCVFVSTHPSTIGSVTNQVSTLPPPPPCTAKCRYNIPPQFMYSLLFLHFSVSSSAPFLLLVRVG